MRFELSAKNKIIKVIQRIPDFKDIYTFVYSKKTSLNSNNWNVYMLYD